ncbi:MAG: ABC transporter permease [Chitinophagaceae bacterium]|nr:ABC transporter permease [Chitinophagaceae bacterium]
MRKTITILVNSLRLTFQEIRANKLRTFLSLIGISFGIFCIIGVLATVNSLEMNIQNQLKSLGTNTIYIDKWTYGAGSGDYPWWKYMKRPEPKFEEVALIRERSRLTDKVGYQTSSNTNIVYKDFALEGVNMSGITPDINEINPLQIEFGRFISGSEFQSGSPVIIMGYTNAENLFGDPERAVGKTVKIKNNQATIIGVIKKMGANFIGENFDQNIYVPYKFLHQMVSDEQASPVIIVKGKSGISSAALSDELEGIMRSIRKLKPTEEDNFTLNQISALSSQVSGIFSSINMGGWAIGILSLVVGAFGISNIMFVTVKERTPIIGLKKAIGAKKRSILTEFLLEAAIICILGGIMGLLLVFILTLVLSQLLNFPVYISVGILSLAISICIVIGILSGIIPAYTASRMDPVVAIRSK